jgi:hypothetical protein
VRKPKELQRIEELLFKWLWEIRVNNALTFYDINKLSEGLSARLLNEIYDYKLIDLNREKRNFPGIDLGDRVNKIAFQITSRIDGYNKIKKDLGTFVRKGHYKTFVKGIRFLILNLKKEVSFGRRINYKKIYPNFDKKKHVLTEQNLIEDIWAIYDENPDKFQRIKNILEVEYGKDKEYRVFVPPNFYPFEPHLISFPSSEIPQFQGYINKVKTFLYSDSTRLLVIHAPGGYGKSHFLRDIALNIAPQVDPERQIRLIRLGLGKIEDAISQELLTDQPYLLMFDDADDIDMVKSLLVFLKSSERENIKLILALKTAGFSPLQQEIVASKCYEITDTIKITDWTKDELIKLLRLSVGTDTVKDEERIVTSYSIPYLTVWAGSKLLGKEIKNFSTLKTEFTETLIRDTQRCLGESNRREVEVFLFILACIVPVYLEDKNLSDSEKQTLKKILDAGIVRQIGGKIRFVPDMTGDLYLLEKFKDFDSNRNSLKNLIIGFEKIYPGNVVTNISSAAKYDQEGKADIVKEIFSELLSQWIHDAEHTPGSVRGENLKKVAKIAFLVPQKTANLISTYLEISAPVEEHSLFGLNTITLNINDYRPVIYELIRIPSARKDVIDIIEKISDVGILNQHEQDEPQSLIRLCVSPGRNDAATVPWTFDILAKWLNNLTPKRVDFLKAALSEVLAGTYEFTNYFSGRFLFGEEALPDTPNILKIRDKAMSILKEMLSHNSLSVQLAAIDVADDIGRTRGRISGKIPLKERFAEERREIVNAIYQMISFNAGFELLSKIEDLFLVWWAAETSGTEKVVNFLRELPRSPEYIVFKWASPSPRSVVKSFSEIETKIPTDRDERWKWFIHEVEYKPWKLEDFSEIAEELNRKYVTALEIIQFFTDLHEKTSSSRSRNTWFLTQWVKINSEMFKKIRENDQMWGQIPERFHGEIDVALSGIEQDHIQKMAEEVLQSLPEASLDQVDDLLFLAGKYLSKQSWKDLITELIEKGNSEIRIRVLDSLIRARIIHSFDKIQDIEAITTFLERILTKENQLYHSLIAGIVGVLNGYIVDNSKVYQINLKEGTLHKRLLELLQDYPSLSWQDQDLAYKLVEWCIKDIDELTDFIEYRLHKSKAMRGYTEQTFEAIPYNGIECLTAKITSFKEYLRLIRKVTEWCKADLHWRDFDIRNLMEPILSLQDEDSHELYLVKSVYTFLQENSVENALICARFLSLTQDTIDVFVEVSERGIKTYSKEVKSLLFGPVRCYSWSCNLGEIPPILIERKTIFEKMLGKVSSGLLREVIEQCVAILQNDIENHVKEYEELLNPRY